MTKSIKFISGFLGISMFMFGILKFVNPFNGWYISQITNSELPFQTFSYWAGQLGEISVGLLLIYLLFYWSKLKQDNFRLFFYAANLLIIIMMLAAFYVHGHPNVSHEVLPMKIKPPFIPGFFLLLGITNILLERNRVGR